ncbi:hypothetical protein DFH06DRAFT_1142107 [Mycena polygramma]|nr:hypothetical protein DFH06DRAFT_1142107 [Mycena polygramma]
MATQRTSSSLFDRLPNELSRMIFHLALRNPKRRVRYRTKFCFCSSDWMRFLMCIPELWSTITVDNDVPPSFVLRFIENAGTLPLEFIIVLDSADPVLSLDYLAPFMHQVDVLRIESDSDETLFRLRQSFHALSAPNARVFTISLKRIPRSGHRSPPPPLITLPWFPGPAAALTYMVVGASAAIPFYNVGFPALRRLCIWGFDPRYTVGAAMVKTVIQSSPVLRVLTLRRFCCTGLTGDLPVIYSSSVKEIELSWAYDNSLSLLVSSFDFPLLTKFTVDLCGPDHVQDVLAVPLSLFSTVTDLIVLNPRKPQRSSYVPATLMFQMFPSLTFLDLSGSRPPLFLEFFDAASGFAASNHGDNLIPALQTLLLPSVDPGDVIALTKLYGARSWSDGADLVLRTIQASCCLCPHKNTGTVASQRSWLSAHISNFNLDLQSCPRPKACAWAAENPSVLW